MQSLLTSLSFSLFVQSFHCRRGKAYLFNNVVNITVGDLEERMMISGIHTEAAYEKSQKYKEGKFVLERGRIVDEIDFSSEVYIDTRPSMSDSEDA
ncbi:hypothetical protein Gotri_011464 [Gossypium trilobum]|uniref:Yippee domain-containing protein n=2 Tax=Gossypium TaxID=3633 RepID=A0A7J9ETU5_9ROSI|nr:hypothetical protein [Gossypium aridum]MBA0776476.1 hypothetical protein [Gossypium trilobum]